MDFVSLAWSSVALVQIINVAHSIDRIEFIWVDGERVRVDYGVPLYAGDADSAYCGFANYQYAPLIFVNIECDTEQFLKHEKKHIEQFQWYYHPAPNEVRRPYEEYRMGFEEQAYEAQEE